MMHFSQTSDLLDDYLTFSIKRNVFLFVTQRYNTLVAVSKPGRDFGVGGKFHSVSQTNFTKVIPVSFADCGVHMRSSAKLGQNSCYFIKKIRTAL